MKTNLEAFPLKNWRKPQGRIWTKQHACTPLQTSTVTDKSRWRNSWEVRLLRWLQPSHARFGWPLFGLQWLSNLRRRNLLNLLQPCLKPSLGPCSLNRPWAADGRVSSATCSGNPSSNSKAGVNSHNKAGANLSRRAGCNPNRCTTFHRPSLPACDARDVVSALTDNGGSVPFVGLGTQRCRIDQSSSNCPFSSKASSSNQIDGLRMTPEMVNPTLLLPPPAVLSPNMK